MPNGSLTPVTRTSEVVDATGDPPDGTGERSPCPARVSGRDDSRPGLLEAVPPPEPVHLDLHGAAVGHNNHTVVCVSPPESAARERGFGIRTVSLVGVGYSSNCDCSPG